MDIQQVATSNQETSLITVEEEHATAEVLYGADKDIEFFCRVVQKVAPWAREFKTTEIGFVVRRALALGLDPLNQHEVQIWKDKGIQFQLSYTLLSEWTRAVHGQHTEPKYETLTEQERADEGLVDGDMAYKVSFIMREDLPKIVELVQSGAFTGSEAREMFTIKGLGVATKKEMDKTSYFAPNARSAGWKVKKRAYTDAVRLRFGTPTRNQIMELRRGLPQANLTISDWEVASEEAPDDPGAMHDIAILNAEARERAQNDERTPEEVLEEGVLILRGTPDEAEWDAPKPPPEPREPRAVVTALREAAGWEGGKRESDDTAEPPLEKSVEIVTALIRGCYPPDIFDEPVIACIPDDLARRVFKRNLENLTAKECHAIEKWLRQGIGIHSPKPAAAREVRTLLGPNEEEAAAG